MFPFKNYYIVAEIVRFSSGRVGPNLREDNGNRMFMVKDFFFFKKRLKIQLRDCHERTDEETKKQLEQSNHHGGNRQSGKEVRGLKGY